MQIFYLYIFYDEVSIKVFGSLFKWFIFLLFRYESCEYFGNSTYQSHCALYA